MGIFGSKEEKPQSQPAVNNEKVHNNFNKQNFKSHQNHQNKNNFQSDNDNNNTNYVYSVNENEISKTIEDSKKDNSGIKIVGGIALLVIVVLIVVFITKKGGSKGGNSDGGGKNGTDSTASGTIGSKTRTKTSKYSRS